LSRSRNERLLFGVCGGLAAYFDIDAALVRIGFVLAGLFPPTAAFSIISYVVLTVILPEEDGIDLPGRDQVKQNLNGLRSDVTQMTESLRSTLGMGSRDARTTVDVDLPPEVPDVNDTGMRSSPASGMGGGTDRPESAEPPRPTGAVR
jgi:phage shock protein PspC (stress-responsive transcriptional regulator)